MKATINLQGYFLEPFQLIMDLNQQLPNPDEEIFQLALTPLCELNTTNDWINLEALGNPVALRAETLHKILSKKLATVAIDKLELDIHCAETITIDNIFALLYIADKLESIHINLYSDTPTKAKQVLIPLENQKNIHITFHNGSVNDDKLSFLKAQRLKKLRPLTAQMDDEWLQNPEITPANMGIIIGYAWSCLKAGAYEISSNLLEHILTKDNMHPTAKEHLFMHLQLIAFLSHQYEKVTNTEFPDHFHYLKSSDSTNLYFIKAYAATLSRNLPIAANYFKKANIDSQLPMTDEVSLFRLNLHALFLVLSGNVYAALKQEHQIEEFIAQNNISTLGLKYVNFINIARVYKKLNQFETALSYYEKAYQEIQGGGFTPSDHIYYNMNYGGLFEAAGQPDKALFYWVKAALHWLTFDNPYALAWRPRVILCQEKVTEILPPLSFDKIHQFLVNKIGLLLSQHPLALDGISAEGITFVSADHQSAKELGYLAENIILYRCQTANSSVKHSSDLAKQLQGLLTQIIRNVMGIHEESITLEVDNHLEDYYPISAEDCLALSIVSGCQQFYYQGQYIQFNREHIKSFFTNKKISLSPVIDSIKPNSDNVQLNYHRSFLNQKLYPVDEMNLVKLCVEQGKVDIIQPDEALVKTLSNLMTKKIVTIQKGSGVYNLA